MKKTYAINKEQFEAMFTEEQQNKVKDTLKAYSNVNVVYEYGEYHFSPSISLKATYAPDHKFIGTVYADDIFTEEERMVNYIEAFHEYPIQYKGKRDYAMLKEVGYDWDAKFKMENGNLVRA